MNQVSAEKLAVTASLKRSPIVGVVRTDSNEQAQAWAEVGIESGIELLEITFSVPEAEALTRRLVDQREAGGPAWIGMGTVTTRERAERAVAAGAEFIVSPNVSADVAEVAKSHGKYLVMGALTPTEIVNAVELGADIVKVYPLPPVGGPAYLSVTRQPLSDLPMLAAGGFGVDEIPAYRQAGAIAFGIGLPLFGTSPASMSDGIQRGLAAARGES